MNFSKRLFPLLILFFSFFPLRHASKPKKCSSSFLNPLRCGPLEVPIRFPLCGHSKFNLYCDGRNKTVLELPISGTFLVRDINYIEQLIHINDPENCLAKRLLTFDLSGTPFSPHFSIYYTFFTCPKEVVLPSSYRSIPCLSNSTSSFFATSFAFTKFMFPSCQIVKGVHVPAISTFEEIDFWSRHVNNQSLLLEWHSPDCKRCEMELKRCTLQYLRYTKIIKGVSCLSDNKKLGFAHGYEPLVITSLIMIGVIAIICVIRGDDPSSDTPIAAARPATARQPPTNSS